MRTLFDNYNTNDEAWFDDYKEHCEMNEIEMPSDAENSNEFYEWRSEMLYMEWEDFIDNIESDKDNDVNCVVTGKVGRWNGTFEIIPKAFPSLKIAITTCVSNMDYVIVSEDDGIIKVEAIHHDGRNNFEIHKLNAKGLEAYCNDEDFDKEEYFEKFNIKL